MMNCPDCEPRLIDYACHELPEDERAAVAGHLATCSDCALEYCRLQVDLEGIAEAHVEAPRPHVYRQLRKQVGRQLGPSRWSRARWLLLRPVPVYGAVLAGLVPAVLWVFTVARTPPNRPGAEPPPVAPPSATLTDYDATEPSPVHRDVL
jgi:anti-sigma factor RsiW